MITETSIREDLDEVEIKVSDLIMDCIPPRRPAQKDIETARNSLHKAYNNISGFIQKYRDKIIDRITTIRIEKMWEKLDDLDNNYSLSVPRGRSI